MRPRWVSTAIAIFLTVATAAPFAFSQATISFAQMNGTVQDSSGRTVAKASIGLREMNTNQAYSATATDSGYYVVPSLPPGRYEIPKSAVPNAW